MRKAILLICMLCIGFFVNPSMECHSSEELPILDKGIFYVPSSHEEVASLKGNGNITFQMSDYDPTTSHLTNKRSFTINLNDEVHHITKEQMQIILDIMGLSEDKK